MEIRTTPEVGIRRIQSFHTTNEGPPVENPAGLPGVDTSNRQRVEEQKATSALRPTDATKVYEVKGATIDERA